MISWFGRLIVLALGLALLYVAVKYAVRGGMRLARDEERAGTKDR